MTLVLLELADELLLSILEQVEHQDDLRSLARTCSRIQDLVDPLLYRSIFYTSRPQLLALGARIHARPQRIAAIRSLESRVRYGTDAFQIGDEMVNLVRDARNLQELIVESPYCNHTRMNAHDGRSVGAMDSLFSSLALNTLRLTQCAPYFTVQLELLYTNEES